MSSVWAAGGVGLWDDAGDDGDNVDGGAIMLADDCVDSMRMDDDGGALDDVDDDDVVVDSGSVMTVFFGVVDMRTSESEAQNTCRSSNTYAHEIWK